MCQCCFCLLFQYVSQSARKAAAIITYSPVSSSWFILGQLPLELPRLHHLPALPPVTCLKQTSMPVLDPIAICLQPILNIYFPTFGKCNFTHQFSAGSNSHLLPLSLSLSMDHLLGLWLRPETRPSLLFPLESFSVQFSCAFGFSFCGNKIVSSAQFSLSQACTLTKQYCIK